MTHECEGYAQTYTSLAHNTHERERWPDRYESHTNPIVATVAGLRATTLTLVLAWFWFASAWPSGSLLVLDGGAICALVASTAKAARMGSQARRVTQSPNSSKSRVLHGLL